jgi:hypothetical protein
MTCRGLIQLLKKNDTCTLTLEPFRETMTLFGWIESPQLCPCGVKDMQEISKICMECCSVSQEGYSTRDKGVEKCRHW